MTLTRTITPASPPSVQTSLGRRLSRCPEAGLVRVRSKGSVGWRSVHATALQRVLPELDNTASNLDALLERHGLNSGEGERARAVTALSNHPLCEAPLRRLLKRLLRQEAQRDDGDGARG